MSLLREIQDAAIDPAIDVTFLLRKCKVLASRLKSPEFGQWVDRELGGYKDKDSLPDYRVIRVQSKGHFSGLAGSGLRNADIPLSCIDKRFRKNLEMSCLMQSISAYADLLARSDGGNFQESWPPDLVAHVSGDIYEYMNCMTAWKVIPRSAIVCLVDAVRNRILNFVLEIESEAPDAGEASPDNAPLPKDQVSHIFHTHIYGSVGNIAQGNRDVTQTARISITENDWDALSKCLEGFGLPQDKVKELENAISSDSHEDVKRAKKLGPRVSSWLGSAISEITQGLIPILQNVDANLITRAILMYYGIS